MVNPSDFMETTLENSFDFSAFFRIYLKKELGSGI